MRVATLSVSDKKQKTIAKSLDRRFIDKKVFNSISSSNTIINEIYFNMDLNQLRSFSNDDEQFSTYINSNSSFLNAGAMNIFFINLKIDQEQPSAEDITFLNHILTWGINEIYVMPTLQFNDVDRQTEKDLYSDFVTKMIESKNSMVPGNLNLGISVPSYYKYKDLDDLYKLYDGENTEPTFVSIDFNRAGINDKKRLGVVNTLNSHYMGRGIENYFLYGLNLRTYQKRMVNPVSDEMVIAQYGLNAMGAPHYEPSKRKIPPTTQVNQLGVVFDPDDYRFHSLVEPKHYDRFLEWSSDFEYSFDLENSIRKDAPKVRAAMKKYNLCMENKEFFELSEAIRKEPETVKERISKNN